ncbi:unnamed protein product [Penicillium palitans]
MWRCQAPMISFGALNRLTRPVSNSREPAIQSLLLKLLQQLQTEVNAFWKTEKAKELMEQKARMDKRYDEELTAFLSLKAKQRKQPEGIEGHRFGLLVCLSWVEEFWTNCEGGYGVVIDEDGGESELFLPQALVDDVAACVRHLVASFDNFIKTHRRAHSLTGTYLAQEAKDAYA